MRTCDPLTVTHGFPHARFRTVALASVLGLAACSVGEGEGEVKSERLFAKDCWDQAYDMGPDFFAGVPYRETLQIRVQRGSDIEEVSDGLSVLIDNVPEIRDGYLDRPLRVALPPGVAPPGSVAQATDDSGEPVIHAALYLGQSCHNQNITLYGISGSVTFSRLFSGDPHEREGAERLTEASFSFLMGDPRDAPLGAKPGEDIPEDRLSRVTGYFRFYFERGQPGQPFP